MDSVASLNLFQVQEQGKRGAVKMVKLPVVVFASLAGA
jgi:hypothetical protein